MANQRASRDVVDLVTRPITQGIDVNGDGSPSFRIDGTGIGLNVPDAAAFTTITMTGAIDMSGQRITNVPFPVAGTDAINRDYVDTSIAGISDFLPLAGGTMLGVLGMGGNSLTGVAAPVAGTDAVNLDAMNAAIAAAIASVPPSIPAVFRAEYAPFLVPGNGVWQDPGHNLTFTTGATGLTVLNMDIPVNWSLSSYDGTAWLEIFSPVYSSIWTLTHQAHNEGAEGWTVNRMWHGTLSPLTTYICRLRYNSHPNNSSSPFGWSVRPIMMALCW